jgi:glutathione synthase/RimK-type ligase-like ATP-grasp enzyme
MILLCGIPSEPPLRRVAEAAEALGIPYVMFNQREAQHSEMHLEVRGGRASGALRIREADWPLEGFAGVFVRLMDNQDLPESRRGRDAFAAREASHKSLLLHEALLQWLELADCRVLNRASAMRSNMSKPFQAQCIARAGFQTPATLVTNDPAEVRRFLEHHKRVIYKSVSSIRSIVKRLDGAKLNDLNKVRHLPTQFQAFVPGTNVRVHVVGERVFATVIVSDAVDYRYAGRDGLDVEMAAVELPPEIEERCVQLSRMLDLPLCGIDLKRTPEGSYFCFEVNPSPAYSYYQEYSGQDIATAIARYLASG